MKFRWSHFLFLIIGLVIGFLGKERLSPKAQINQVQNESTEIKKLEVITPEMIEDYYRLQSLEEKYQKADELLGKIIVTLLQDLGHKLNKETIKMAENSARGDGLRNIQTGSIESESNKKLEKSVVAETMEIKKWQVFEQSLDQVQTITQANEFLEKVKIENFDNALKASTNFKNTQQNLESIIGKFEGSADVTYSGKARIWQIEIDMDLRMNQGSLRGRSQIKLSENGRVFSNSTDRGEPKNIREFSNESVALMIRASPSIIFQVYYLKTSDNFIGNVYRLDGDEINYKYVGTLKLNRKG